MALNCSVSPVEKAICEDQMAEAQMARLLVWGLVCPNCAICIQNALVMLDGVISAAVDGQRGLAFVDYLPPQTNPHALVRAIGCAGCHTAHGFYAALIE